MISRRRLVWALFALVILVALVVAGRQGAPRPPLILVTDTVEDDSLLIRIDHFAVTYQRETGGVEVATSPLSVWFIQHSSLFARLWWSTHKTYAVAPSGTIFVIVEATVVPKGGGAILADAFAYRLDYGAYTIGSGNRQVTMAPDHPPKIATLFTVTDGPEPKALEIRVNGRWYRFPVTR